MKKFLTILIFCFVLTHMVSAADYVFDFSKKSDIKNWKSVFVKPLLKPLNKGSLPNSSMFELKVLEVGKKPEDKPLVEAVCHIKDWTKFERLEIDFVNPTNKKVLVGMLISDSKTPLEQGWIDVVSIAPKTCIRIVRPMYYFPKGVDKSDIQKFQFYLPNASKGDTVLIDNVILLEKGEKNPEPAKEFKQEIDKLYHEKLTGLSSKIEHKLKSLECSTQSLSSNSLVSSLKNLAAEVKKEINGFSLAECSIYDFEAESAKIDKLVKKYNSLSYLLKFCSFPDAVNKNFGVAFASSMQKIKPLFLGGPLRASRKVKCSLARNEKESFQVVVIPFKKQLKDVSVNISELKSDDGEVLNAEDVEVSVVGFVNVDRSFPKAKIDEGDWWPDPILGYMKSTDVEVGTLQSFWVRISTKPNQHPGKYKGMITVSAKDCGELTFDMEVEVYNFELPSHSPYPLAVAFLYNRGYARAPIGEKWEEKKYKYADFLSDYLIDYDNIYNLKEPDWDVMMYQHKQGKLIATCLGYYYVKDDAGIKATIDRFRPYYEKAKKLGILDHVYVYGFDEQEKEEFPGLSKIAEAFHKELPGLFVMTTARDHTYGLASKAKAVNAWVPPTNHYYPMAAARARLSDTKVWWYICCGPRIPWANIFIKYPAIEARLLMGAMASKFKPDGFLYYSITQWGNNGRIEGGPFLPKWNPATMGQWYGDGYWLYPGPEGLPIASTRLENFRDGLEDYAYAAILEATLEKVKSDPKLFKKHSSWIRKATKVLNVPSTLVNTLTKFTHNPARLMKYRSGLAAAIQSAPIKPVDPWEKGMNIRGIIE